MKKIIYILAISAIAFASCKKQDGASGLATPPEAGSLPPVPSSFGKKVLIEELTGAWCGWCPRGAYFMDSMTVTYPSKVVGVAIHVGDVMEDAELVSGTNNILDQDLFHNTGYPNGSVDRGVLDDPSNWPSLVPAETGLNAKCGFAIDATSISGNTLNLVVHTGFATDMPSDYRLNVFIVEAVVHSTNTDYDQHNYYSNSDPSIQLYYNLPAVINDFHHKNVLRKVVTPITPFGLQIPQSEMVKGHDYTKSFSVDLSGLSWSNCYVVTFLDKYAPGPTTDPMHPQHQVQNVQRVKIGESIGWN